MSASKIKVKQDEVGKKLKQLNALKVRVKKLEVTLASSAPRETKDEFHGGIGNQNYSNSQSELRQKKIDAEVAIKRLEDENEELEKRVNELQNRKKDAKDYLREQEQNAGVVGYRETREKLLDLDAETQVVNKLKVSKRFSLQKSLLFHAPC